MLAVYIQYQYIYITKCQLSLLIGIGYILQTFEECTSFGGLGNLSSLEPVQGEVVFWGTFPSQEPFRGELVCRPRNLSGGKLSRGNLSASLKYIRLLFESVVVFVYFGQVRYPQSKKWELPPACFLVINVTAKKVSEKWLSQHKRMKHGHWIQDVLAGSLRKPLYTMKSANMVH